MHGLNANAKRTGKWQSLRFELDKVRSRIKGIRAALRQVQECMEQPDGSARVTDLGESAT